MKSQGEISPEAKNKKFQGNILLFYGFDVGDEIDLKEIEQRGLLATHTVPLSPYFKNYHVPLSFHLRNASSIDSSDTTDCITSKIYHFGVISLCYRIPFDTTLDNLKHQVITIKKQYDEKSERDALTTFNAIKPTINDCRFYNLKNSYFALHITPPIDEISPSEFKKEYASKIASLLRLEVKNLSQSQTDEILSSTIGYYGQDLIIIDGQGSIIYDDEYFEPMEFFESANVQQLELQCFDRLLNNELNYFYKQPSFKIPLTSYIPLLGMRTESPSSRLSKLRVDISVVTERLENSIKMTGDTYLANLYRILVEKFSLREWRDSIQRKLSIIKDLYQVHQDRLDIIHEEILTMVIIILISFELILAFHK